MDQQTNKQEPSGTEGGQVKAGDKVWVKAIVEFVEPGSVRIAGLCGGGFWTVEEDCRPVEPSSCPEIPDSSSEPMRGAFERSMAERYDWYQGYFSRNEDRYFDSSVEMAWQAFRAGAKYGDPRGCPETTDKEPQCEKDLWWGPVSDPVNPSHYKQGGIECIEAIKAATGEGFTGYVWGNVLKYLWRWPKKGGVEDLKKARWYLDRLIKEVGE